MQTGISELASYSADDFGKFSKEDINLSIRTRKSRMISDKKSSCQLLISQTVSVSDMTMFSQRDASLKKLSEAGTSSSGRMTFHVNML